MSTAAGLDWTDLDAKAVDTARVLAMDAVQKVGNGHPGTAMSLAPAAYLLFQKVMRHNPANPDWSARDRFVLSAGHSSITLYTQLFLGGFGLELEDLKSLRTWGSKTPGHPEHGHTAGVETTTGPLGQGVANAVGMAMAARRERGLLDPDAANTGTARAELGVGDVVIPLRSGEEIVLAVSRATLSRGDGRAGVLLVLREVTEHRSGLRPLAGFASTAAHDLRGPLSAIRSWLSLAVDDLEPGSDALMPLRRAERSAEQMADLIGDLLEHALAESGELRATAVRLGGPDGVLAQTAGLLGPDDVLEVEEDLPDVHADPVAVRQLFGNLVGNAVKYATPGEHATITVRAQRQAARVEVEIEDRGVGVEEEERSLIFQRFHRSGSVRAHFRGTGMGLTICQTIVQRHGGTIECLPRPVGSGSVFRFDLPAVD